LIYGVNVGDELDILEQTVR